MISVHTVLLLSALFYACSALRFAGTKRRDHAQPSYGFWVTEESNDHIQISHGSRANSVILSLQKDKLGITMKAEDHDFVVCIHRDGVIKSCHQNNSEYLQLHSNDVLLIGNLSEKHKILSAVWKGFKLNGNPKYLDIWRKDLQERNLDFFIVPVKEDDMKRDDTSLELSFSKIVKRGDKTMTSVETFIEIESKTKIHMTHKSRGYPPDFHWDLDLVGNKLNTTTEDFFLCIYRNKEFDRCYHDVNIKNLQLSPNDTLIFAFGNFRDYALHALEEDLLSIHDFTSIDSWSSLSTSNARQPYYIVSIGNKMALSEEGA